MLDGYAARSHELVAAAIDRGAFEGQLVPVSMPQARLEIDEGLRRGTSVETLARLKPSFQEDGVIHAGNASQIADGAAALLIMTERKAGEFGLKPLARLHAGSVVGADPVMMLTAPIPATQKVLHRCGLSIDDIDAFEVNEAFAPVPMVWQREVGARLERLNPLGASGAILATRLIHHMREAGIRYGLQTMCEGGGTANARFSSWPNDRADEPAAPGTAAAMTMNGKIRSFR